jgi:uncharacterized protein (TIGR02611 family)
VTKTGQLKEIWNSPGLRQVRRMAVLLIGGVVLLAGVAMLVLPGPAFVVIPLGFAILATEFEWARRWTRTTVKFLRKATSKKNIKRLVYENSLSLTLFLLFAIFLAGQLIAGHRTYNTEQGLENRPQLTFASYAFSGHAIEATFENWESEFLQMWAFVLLTVFLRQKGAADSKEMHEKGARDEVKPRANSPWPVRRGGWILRLYEHSLGLTLLSLFFLSFALHAIGGTEEHNQEQARHGLPPVSVAGYVATSKFWFESSQNWQSEFLSVGVLLVFSIFLREKGSTESKLVAAPNVETG